MLWKTQLRYGILKSGRFRHNTDGNAPFLPLKTEACGMWADPLTPFFTEATDRSPGISRQNRSDRRDLI